MATTLLAPAGSELALTLRTATPVLPLAVRDTVPRVCAPSVKVTVPPGVPEPAPLTATVAVKLTVCP